MRAIEFLQRRIEHEIHIGAAIGERGEDARSLERCAIEMLCFAHALQRQRKRAGLGGRDRQRPNLSPRLTTSVPQGPPSQRQYHRQRRLNRHGLGHIGGVAGDESGCDPPRQRQRQEQKRRGQEPAVVTQRPGKGKRARHGEKTAKIRPQGRKTQAIERAYAQSRRNQSRGQPNRRRHQKRQHRQNTNQPPHYALHRRLQGQ
jgi:hypothetical protein